jgi:hypothetical protein
VDQEARDGLLAELLQKEIKRLRRVIDEMQRAGENLHQDTQYMVPKSPESFNTTIHERHRTEWAQISREAGNLLRER